MKRTKNGDSYSAENKAKVINTDNVEETRIIQVTLFCVCFSCRAFLILASVRI